jgi:hypothetical protein
METGGVQNLSQSAYIKLVEGSGRSTITLAEVQELLLSYKEQTARTGEQLDWSYADAAFPYTIETKPGAEEQWFYLKGTHSLYKYIIFGVGKETREDKEIAYIQVVLPDHCTHGDKAKANEFCRYLARKLQAELHMFNGRIMYFYPRK